MSRQSRSNAELNWEFYSSSSDPQMFQAYKNKWNLKWGKSKGDKIIMLWKRSLELVVICWCLCNFSAHILSNSTQSTIEASCHLIQCWSSPRCISESSLYKLVFSPVVLHIIFVRCFLCCLSKKIIQILKLYRRDHFNRINVKNMIVSTGKSNKTHARTRERHTKISNYTV